MKLKTEQGQLTLPSDFSFEIEQNSAFFSDNGSTSLAATIPATPEDQAKLGWPTRLGRSTRFVNAYPASIEQGSFHKKGTLMVTSATERNITCSMALEDSDLYARHKNDNLKDLFADVVRTDYSTAEDWYDFLMSVYVGFYDCEFRLFPVAVEDGGDEYSINNAPDPDYPHSGLRDLVHASRIIMQGDERVSVPEGFGIAPFLKLGWFVAKVVTLCGYTVEYNCFTADSRLSDLVLLHNCTDAICDGTIHYADLVPNKTVGELIGWLCDKFNIQFSVNPSVGTARIIQMENILAGSADMDVTSKVMGRKTYSYSPTSRVILSSDTSLDGAAPAMDTLEELKAKWGQVAELNETQWRNPANGLVLRKSTGEYFVVKEFIEPHSWAVSEKVLERLGSNYFTYDRRNSDQSEGKNAADLMVPMVWVDDILCPFIGERIYCRTTVNNKEERQQQEIMICEFAGLSFNADYQYGTTQKYSDHGTLRQNRFTWNAPEMYRQFWPLYNKMLRNNRVEVSCQLNLQQQELLQYNLYALKHMDGQHLIPSYLRYEVGRKIRCLEARFYLVKDYTDGQEDEDTVIPATLYKWEINRSEINAAVQAVHDQYGDDYYYQEEFCPDDPFEEEQPPIYLPPPSALGLRTMQVTRSIDVWVKDWIDGSTIARVHITPDTWFDSVNV